MGGCEYNGSTLEYIYNGFGRVRPETGAYHYDYYLTDHLGSTRVIFTDDGSGNAEILQANNYYPFGMQFNEQPEYVSEQNNYLYNGKELVNNSGLNWHNYGWRHYDASLGRWNAQDPLAEKYSSYSPYNYVINNPIKYIDPDGRDLSLFSILSILWNSKHGGTWRNTGGDGSFTFFGSSGDGAAALSRYVSNWGMPSGGSGSGKVHSWGFTIKFKGIARLFKRVFNPRKNSYKDHININFSWTSGIGSLNPYSMSASLDGGGLVQNGVGRINFMDNLDNSARHLINAIKYSMENGGNGVVNIDKIFSNYNPNTNPGSGQGFHRSFQMTIGDRDLALQIHFATPVSTSTGSYDPIIDFSLHNTSQTSKSFENGYYFHDFYLGGGRSKYGARISVGDARPNLWDNFTYFGEWMWNW